MGRPSRAARSHQYDMICCRDLEDWPDFQEFVAVVVDHGDGQDGIYPGANHPEVTLQHGIYQRLLEIPP